jgi:hypothetical protein
MLRGGIAPQRVVLGQALQVALLNVDQVIYGGAADVHHSCCYCLAQKRWGLGGRGAENVCIDGESKVRGRRWRGMECSMSPTQCRTWPGDKKKHQEHERLSG